MNFNIYINEKLGTKISKVSKSLRRSRNSIITEALEEWLDRHASEKWPKGFFDFEPIQDVPDFKSYRKELKKEIFEDPLQ